MATSPIQFSDKGKLCRRFYLFIPIKSRPLLHII
nr:MAG TPA: hypothetical protein [Caudoviricetes sp.]